MKQPRTPAHLREWQVLTREVVLDCQPWLRLSREKIRLPDGREIDDYYQIEQRDYVLIAAWQNGKVFGLWRYKHGPRNVNLGLPAGYRERDEDPLQAAQRELREEAGLESSDWNQVGSYCVDGNRSQARAHIFVARDCRSTEARDSDDLEDQIGEWLSPLQWAEYLGSERVTTLGAAMAVHAAILAFAK
jgi:ADP-ribose pyrophosphatase